MAKQVETIEEIKKDDVFRFKVNTNKDDDKLKRQGVLASYYLARSYHTLRHIDINKIKTATITVVDLDESIEDSNGEEFLKKERELVIVFKYK